MPEPTICVKCKWINTHYDPHECNCVPAWTEYGDTDEIISDCKSLNHGNCPHFAAKEDCDAKT